MKIPKLDFSLPQMVMNHDSFWMWIISAYSGLVAFVLWMFGGEPNIIWGLAWACSSLALLHQTNMEWFFKEKV